MSYNDLPVETIYAVLLSCDYMSLLEVAKVNKQGYAIYTSEDFWKAKILHDYGDEGWNYPFYTSELSNHGRYVAFATVNLEFYPGIENLEGAEDIFRYINCGDDEIITKLSIVYSNNLYLDPIFPNGDRIINHIYNYLIDMLVSDNILDTYFPNIWNGIFRGKRELTKQILVDFYVLAYRNKKEVAIKFLRSFFCNFPQTCVTRDDKNIKYSYDDYYLATIFQDVGLLDHLLNNTPLDALNRNIIYTIANNYGWKEGKERINAFWYRACNRCTTIPDINLRINAVKKVSTNNFTPQVDHNTLEDSNSAIDLRYDAYDKVYTDLQEKSKDKDYKQVLINYFQEALIIGHRGYMRYFIRQLQSNDVCQVVKHIYGPKNNSLSVIYALYLNLTAFTRKEFVQRNITIPKLAIITINEKTENIIPPKESCCVDNFPIITDAVSRGMEV